MDRHKADVIHAILKLSPSGLFRFSRLILACVFAGYLATLSIAHAQGEHSRRAAAELRVIVGDIKRLQDPTTSELHRRGLKKRILSGLSALDILLRLADQEIGNPPALYSAEIDDLRANLIDGKLSAMQPQLQRWLKLYPLTTIKFASTQTIDTNLGEKLHKELCAPCHDKPISSTERPAYNLFDEASNLPLPEFLARMFVGVRGDRVTGIDNPLSDYEVAAMLNFYLSRK